MADCALLVQCELAVESDDVASRLLKKSTYKPINALVTVRPWGISSPLLERASALVCGVGSRHNARILVSYIKLAWLESDRNHSLGEILERARVYANGIIADLTDSPLELSELVSRINETDPDTLSLSADGLSISYHVATDDGDLEGVMEILDWDEFESAIIECPPEDGITLIKRIMELDSGSAF